MIEIIDDYLSQTDADHIERLFLKDYSLPWFIADGMTYFVGEVGQVTSLGNPSCEGISRSAWR
jgi:hypothetical protein